MNVVFRADASLAIGTGHVMLCLALAEVLRERGAKVKFICREHDGNLIQVLEERDIQVMRLPRPPQGSPSASHDGYGSWLGVTQPQDALETAEGLRRENADWIVVDHYALDAEWEARIRPTVHKLMAIDDLADRAHDCDVLLDHNYSEQAERYAQLVPKGCRRLLGPRYALLGRKFRAYRRSVRAHRGKVETMLVFFGGSDPENTSRRALEALSVPGLRHVEVDLVVGANNQNRAELERLAAARGRTRVHGLLPDLAELMAGADLGLGAGGTTTWERMCLGLPSIIVSIADNQRPASQALAGAGLAHYAGHRAEASVDRIASMLGQLDAEPSILSEMSLRGQLLVDGLGAARVAEVLLPTSAEQIELRAAEEDDVVAFFNWANDPGVRSNAINTQPIQWPEHREWFARRIRSDASRLFVLEAAALPVGQIRFDHLEGEARIDYSLDEIVRGRGWGQHLVTMGMDAMRKEGPVDFSATVKAANPPSHAVFRRLGFEAAHTDSAGSTVYRKHLPGTEMHRSCN